MEHQLPELPYAKNALEPHISAETLEYHHGKHHQSYVNKLNELIKGSRYEHMPLEEVILSSTNETPVYNNAAQVWNHTFFWNCLSPKGGGIPTGNVSDLINKKWGNFDKFKEEFSAKAVGNFGSGWTWLIQNKQEEIDILNTSNAQTPKTLGHKALLTVDVWEHAYYIDYRNRRPDFIKSFWNLVNWDFVNRNLQ